MVTSLGISRHAASDTSVNGLYGSALAEVVRKAVDSVAAPQAAQRGSGSNAPATLPNGECGEHEGRSPSPLDSLDSLASNVTPRALRKAHLKELRHRMRRTAGHILPHERVRKCGQWMLGGNPTIHKTELGHHFSGLETCGSVWHCPVCAARISEQRCQDVEFILDRHHSAGGSAYLMTLTIPHYAAQTCLELLNTVRGIWRSVKQGNPWVRAKDKYGYLGDIRALEVTHGGNGWHPHLHILIFLRPGVSDLKAEALGLWFYERWARYVHKRGYGPCSIDAFTFKKASGDRGAAEYVGKWGIAQELTKTHAKRGKGGRTPWEILRDAEDCNDRDSALFSEYGRDFKGARQLTWSRGLRDYYGLDAEAPDDELTEEPGLPQTHVASIHRELWLEISHEGLTAIVLTAFDRGGLNGLWAALARYGLDVAVNLVPSLEVGRHVPMLVPAAMRTP